MREPPERFRLFTVLLESSPTDLHYNSLCCAPSTAQHSMHSRCLSSHMLYISLYDTLLCVNLAEIIRFLNCGMIPTHYNGSCILVIATWVAGAWRWLPYSKLTVVHWGEFVGFLKNVICLINSRNMDRMEMVWGGQDSEQGVRRTWR